MTATRLNCTTTDQRQQRLMRSSHRLADRTDLELIQLSRDQKVTGFANENHNAVGSPCRLCLGAS